MELETIEIEAIETIEIEATSFSTIISNAPDATNAPNTPQTPKKSSASSSLDSGVFTIPSPTRLNILSTFRSPRTPSPDTLSYTRHNYLDVRPFTLYERLHLARLHYFTLPNLLRLLAVLFCTSMFTYLALTTLGEFTDHGTVVHLRYTPPIQTFPPAITICSHCVLCSFPDEAVSKLSARSFLSKAIKDLNGSSNDYGNIHLSCILRPKSSSGIAVVGKKEFHCNELVPPVKSSQEGRKCTTYFSDITGQTTRALANHSQLSLLYDMEPIIAILVSGKYIEHSTVATMGFENIQNSVENTTDAEKNKDRITGIFISIHNPNILPYMHNMATHQLLPGTLTIAPFVKRIQRLLPPPYQTACSNYYTKSDPKFATYQQFRTQGQCLLHCMWNRLNDAQPCVNFYSIYTPEMITLRENVKQRKILRAMLTKQNGPLINTTSNVENGGFYKICPRTNDSVTEYMTAKDDCLKQCPVACHEEYFEESGKSYEVKQTFWPNASELQIFWDTESVVEIEHRPKWDRPDLLGQIGGMAHIWLGVSLINGIWAAMQWLQRWQLFPQSLCNPIGSIGHC